MSSISSRTVTVVGGGLAGCEAAWQLLKAGLEVQLIERRPLAPSPAHATNHLAELVCSNSLRSNALTSAAGLLKAELRLLDSLIIACADCHTVPAGQALAVDRESFYACVEEQLKAQAGFSLHHEELSAVPEGPVIIATGPLTEGAFAESLAALLGEGYLSFYDAIAPIIDGDSVDQSKAFWQSRYGKGEGDDYLNCPLTEAEYKAFIAALRQADQYPAHDFEDIRHFEGCLPIEEMAARGEDVLRFGPMKPVGLTDPRTGEMPYAVLQLRKDDLAAEHFNMVGFQTKMRKADQRRVLRMIPALHEAQFSRMGQMHRNSYVNAPSVLEPSYQVKGHQDIFIAGQLSGVEGYIESAASGLVAGRSMAEFLLKGSCTILPAGTATGALGHYIANAEPGNFQPMNITFGLLQQQAVKPRRPRRARREAQSRLALQTLEHWLKG